MWRHEGSSLARLGDDRSRITGVAVTGTGRFFAVADGARVLTGEVSTGATGDLTEGLAHKPCCVATQGDGIYLGAEPAAVYRFDAAFQRWELLGELHRMDFAEGWSSPSGQPAVRSMAPHPNVPGALYADIHVGGVVRTLDGGLTWEWVSEGLEQDVHQVTATPARPDNVYAATADGFYRSRNEGDRWDRMNEGLENLYCRAVAVHPTCPEVILISGSPTSPAGWSADGKRFAVFRSDNAGKTWQRVMHGLPAEMADEVDSHCLSFSTHHPERAFCGRRNGVLYQSLDLGLTWDEIAGSLPRVNAFAVT